MLDTQKKISVLHLNSSESKNNSIQIIFYLDTKRSKKWTHVQSLNNNIEKTEEKYHQKRLCHLDMKICMNQTLSLKLG